MNLMDFAIYYCLGLFVGIQVTSFYNKYIRVNNLTMEESESLIPRYIKLLEYRKKKSVAKSINF